MSSRVKFKAPIDGDPSYDAEVMDDDDERWVRNPSGDLDWEYTARTLKRLSPDALIEYLVNNAITVPARDYNPSAPFVHIKFAASQGGNDEGEVAVTTVSLPHGYRLPLMFVTKYMWATALRTLPSEKEWKGVRGNIIHLCRLCENLFRRAHAKALQGGMEKGWRCIMFDRLLARFYKHWDKSNPSAIIGFAKTHGLKEYDRDVLKHDWKRWCLRGLNGVKMTENEVIDGIMLEQNIATLERNPTTRRWQLNGTPLAHISTKSDPDYMTEVSSLSSLSSDEEAQEEEEDTDVEVVRVRLRAMPLAKGVPAQRQEEEEDEDDDIVMLGTERTSNSLGSGNKRPHDFPALDQDELERQQKRTRIEESLASPSVHPNVGDNQAETGNNTGVPPSTEGLLNSNLHSTTNTDAYSNSTISRPNPGLISPIPVLAPTDPWTPLPPSAFQPFLIPQALPQFTNTKALAGTNADSSHTPVASKSGSATTAAKTRTGGSATATGKRLLPNKAPAPADMSHNQKQPEVPAWKLLDSMVPPRGSRSQAVTSASAAKKMTRPADKGKGKEKPTKTRTTRAKSQKEREGQKAKEVSTVDTNTESSKDTAKVWPNKSLFGPYGKQHNGLHGTAVSSSAILASASAAPLPVVRATRRATESGRASLSSALAVGVIEVPDTDSEPQLDEDDNVASNRHTDNPQGRNARGKTGVDRNGDDIGEIPVHLIQAKALELLISLVTDSSTGTSSNTALAASVTALATNASVNAKSTNSDTTATPLPLASSNAVASSSKTAPQPTIGTPTPLSSSQVHQAFQNTTAAIPGRLSPLSAAAVSQFSNQCTQECAGFNNEHGRRLPHPHNPMYPPIGHRGVSGKVGAPYNLFPPAYLRYERRLRKLLEEHGEGAAVGVDGSMGNETGLLARYQSQFQGADIDEDQEDDARSDRGSDGGKDNEVPIVKKVTLRLEDFEERFAGVKAELVSIVERLVALENKDVERAARELLEEQARATAQATQAEFGSQVPADRGSKDVDPQARSETQYEMERGSNNEKETEQGSPGLVDDMYVDDPATEGGAPSAGVMNMNTQMEISFGDDFSQTTQPAITSAVPPEDASSSTLVDKSKSSSPPPNPHNSSAESIASSNGDNLHINGDHISVSETDGSELTTVNAPGKEDMSVDDRAPVLTSSISRLVEELVHAKMLTIMEGSKLKESAPSADDMENFARAPSPSLATQPQSQQRLQEPTPDVATLTTELCSLKAEFKEREQKDKEEKLAMRELHSAEVDALRRRLSYLENRDPGPMAMPIHMAHRYYAPPFIPVPGEHGSPGEHHPHHMSAPPGGEYFDAERPRRPGFLSSISHGGYAREAPYADGGGSAGDAQSQERGPCSASSATPTPVPSDKGKSAQQPPSVETPPLPIKSQRKQHFMSFQKTRLP